MAIALYARNLFLQDAPPDPAASGYHLPVFVASAVLLATLYAAIDILTGNKIRPLVKLLTIPVALIVVYPVLLRMGFVILSVIR